MWKWLLRLWNSFNAWIQQRPMMPPQHRDFSEPYHPSNLHARHR